MLLLSLDHHNQSFLVRESVLVLEWHPLGRVGLRCAGGAAGVLRLLHRRSSDVVRTDRAPALCLQVMLLHMLIDGRVDGRLLLLNRS